MRNWKNTITAILNTRCSSYPYITPALSTLHRTRPYIRRGTIERERERRKVEDEHMDMIERPVIGSTTLLTIVISMQGIPIIPLLSSQLGLVHTTRFNTDLSNLIVVATWKHQSNCLNRC